MLKVKNKLSEIENAKLQLLAYGWEKPDNNRKIRTFEREYYRIHFILRGEGYYFWSGNEYHLHAGSGFIVFPGEIPKYQVEKDNPWEYFWLAVSGDEMKRLIKKTKLSRSQPIYHCGEDKEAAVDALCGIHNLILDRGLSIEQCMAAFFDCVKPFEAEVKKNSNYFDTSIRFIHENYRQQITIDDVARNCTIDRTYLYKLFKKNLGISPQEYLLKYRVKKACELLRLSEDSMIDIAYTVGFQDYSAFSKQFKKYCLMSPKEYRREKDKEVLF